MRRIWLVPAVWLAAVLESGLPVMGVFPEWRVPLLWGLTAAAALTWPLKPLLVLAAVAGLLRDTLDLGPPGGSVAGFMIAALLIWRIRRHTLTELLVTRMVCGGVGAVLAGTVYVIWQAGAGEMVLMQRAWLQLGRVALAGALVVPILFRLMQPARGTLPGGVS